MDAGSGMQRARRARAFSPRARCRPARPSSSRSTERRRRRSGSACWRTRPDAEHRGRGLSGAAALAAMAGRSNFLRVALSAGWGGTDGSQSRLASVGTCGRGPEGATKTTQMVHGCLPSREYLAACHNQAYTSRNGAHRADSQGKPTLGVHHPRGIRARPARPPSSATTAGVQATGGFRRVSRGRRDRAPRPPSARTAPSVRNTSEGARRARSVFPQVPFIDIYGDDRTLVATRELGTRATSAC